MDLVTQDASRKKPYTPPTITEAGAIERLTEGEAGALPDVGAIGSL